MRRMRGRGKGTARWEEQGGHSFGQAHPSIHRARQPALLEVWKNKMEKGAHNHHGVAETQSPGRTGWVSRC